MCITAPARVIAVDAAGATIEIAGRLRRAAILVVPDIAPGDWVVVGAGSILRRLDEREAIELTASIDTAIAVTWAATPTGGGPR